MLRWRHTVLSTGALLAAVLGLAACGQGATPSAQPSTPVTDEAFAGRTALEILTAARDAATQAGSVHVEGSLTRDGKAMDVRVDVVDGKGAAGTVTLDGAQVRFRQIGDTTYAIPSKEFLTAQGPLGAALGKMLGSKWLKADASIAAAAGLGDLTKQFATSTSAIDANLPKDAPPTRVAGKDVDGVRTVGLSFGTAPQSGILYVAATGAPYPLLLEGPAFGEIELTDWSQAVSLKAPREADVVDFAKIGLAGLAGQG